MNTKVAPRFSMAVIFLPSLGVISTSEVQLPLIQGVDEMLRPLD